MTKNEKFTNARNHSRTFMLAAQRCNEPRPLPSGLLQWLLVPTLVNYAFSIEVGLKALALHQRGEAEKIHDLRELLDDLSPDLRARIVADTGFAPFFERDLDLVRDVCEVWRYIYEKGPRDTDLAFLQRFGAAVQKALESVPAHH